MEQIKIMNYVKPELIVVAVALYFLGMGLKQAQAVKDKYIPLILGAFFVAQLVSQAAPAQTNAPSGIPGAGLASLRLAARPESHRSLQAHPVE